jgi:hypothetical protein
MASGHVDRANRPNTWPLRPTPQSEDSSCQPGAVHTWPVADMAAARSGVRFQGDTVAKVENRTTLKISRK